MQTVEYCVLEQVGEAGIYEEVCYEIEIPAECELINPEAGVYIVDCPEVSVNPLLGELPGMFVDVPDDNDKWRWRTGWVVTPRSASGTIVTETLLMDGDYKSSSIFCLIH